MVAVVAFGGSLTTCVCCTPASGAVPGNGANQGGPLITLGDVDMSAGPPRTRQAMREWILDEYESTGLTRRLTQLDLQVNRRGASQCVCGLCWCCAVHDKLLLCHDLLGRCWLGSPKKHLAMTRELTGCTLFYAPAGAALTSRVPHGHDQRACDCLSDSGKAFPLQFLSETCMHSYVHKTCFFLTCLPPHLDQQYVCCVRARSGMSSVHSSVPCSTSCVRSQVSGTWRIRVSSLALTWTELVLCR
jgi:hypothetical protein